MEIRFDGQVAIVTGSGRGMARHPQPQVMLGGGHRVPIDTTHVLLEVRYPCWHILGCNARLQ